MLTKFTQISVQDQTLSRIQDNVSRVVNRIVESHVLDGVLLRNVSLTIGDNTINHTLGRSLTGWMLTRTRGASTVYDKQDTNLLPARTLVLNASAAVVVDIYAF